MLQLKRTDSDDPGFQSLVRQLDKDLAIRNGDDNAFFAQFNKIAAIRHVVMAYDGVEPVGCGAVKEYEPGVMEVKRMFVPPQHRGKGIAAAILKELECWAAESGYGRCILETGLKMPEAIALYTKSDYRRIENYGQYAGVADSVCFEKLLN